MKTDSEILEICKAAKMAADKVGDNWADYVDGALTAAGIDTDESAARQACNEGKMNVVAVLADRRVVECWDDGSWHINEAPSYSEYAVTISSDPNCYGDCTRAEAVQIADKLQQMVVIQFPGVTVQRTGMDGSPTPTRGPEIAVVEEINEWIQTNWMAALYKRQPDDEDYREGLWSHCCAAVQ